jgi:uncharacterized membrane protein
MDPVVRAVLAVLMRWIHVASVVTLIGGFIFARYALAPALMSLPEAEHRSIEKRVIAGFRPLLYAVIVTILGSGLYNYLTKASYPPRYHVWIGLKLLFVLHIFAVAILYAKREVDESKRNRWLTGMVVSGLIVIAISAYLRYLSLA